MLRALPWVVSLLSATAFAANPHLERAKSLLDDLAFEKAVGAVEKGRAVQGNDAETTAALYEVEAIALANLGRGAKATDAFRHLLVLLPDYQLSSEHPPRVRTPFLEARDWVERHGALSLAIEADGQPGTVEHLAFKVSADALKLVRSLRVHVAPSEGAARDETLSLTDGRATVAIGAPSVSYVATLVGERGAALITRKGTLDNPKPAPPPAPTPPVAAVVEPPPPAPPLEVATVAPSSPAWKVPTAIVFLVAGAAGVGVGAWFGAQSQSARNTLSGATKNMNGVVTSLTLARAAQLDHQAIFDAQLANSLFLAGGVIAAVGAVLLFLPLSDSAHVSVSPTGAAVSGRF
jgi:hypothetical protein